MHLSQVIAYSSVVFNSAQKKQVQKFRYIKENIYFCNSIKNPI